MNQMERNPACPLTIQYDTPQQRGTVYLIRPSSLKRSFRQILSMSVLSPPMEALHHLQQMIYHQRFFWPNQQNQLLLSMHYK